MDFKWEAVMDGMKDPLSSGLPSDYKQHNTDANHDDPTFAYKQAKAKAVDISLNTPERPGTDVWRRTETPLEREKRILQDTQLHEMREAQYKLGNTNDAILRALRKELVDEVLRDMGLKPWYTPPPTADKATDLCGVVPEKIKRDNGRCLCWNNHADYIGRPCGCRTLCTLCFSEYEKREHVKYFCPKCYADVDSREFQPALVEDDPKWMPTTSDTKPEDVLTLEDMMVDEEDASIDFYYDDDDAEKATFYGDGDKMDYTHLLSDDDDDEKKESNGDV
jgi:hypothetical protein